LGAAYQTDNLKLGAALLVLAGVKKSFDGFLSSVRAHDLAVHKQKQQQLTPTTTTNTTNYINYN
jgi:hypothetical protein